jgi:hypothetical protein
MFRAGIASAEVAHSLGARPKDLHWLEAERPLAAVGLETSVGPGKG